MSQLVTSTQFCCDCSICGHIQSSVYPSLWIQKCQHVLGLCRLRVGRSAELCLLLSDTNVASQNRSLVDENKDYTYPEWKRVYKLETITDGHYTTWCEACNYTCHDRCVRKDSAEKADCACMDSDGKCTMCPRKCDWRVHHNRDYVVVWSDVVEHKTIYGKRLLLTMHAPKLRPRRLR
jgi:hypothetical protein